MKIVGCNLHAKTTNHSRGGERYRRVHGEDARHEGNAVREFYAALEGPVVVGIEATGAKVTQWRRSR
jgi:hypothetical protein